MCRRAKPLPLSNPWAQAALDAGRQMYVDPDSGYSVFTSGYLKARPCCGNKCRCAAGSPNIDGSVPRSVLEPGIEDVRVNSGRRKRGVALVQH